MKKFLAVIAAAITLNAGVYTNQLIQCMVNHSSQNDIKVLKTWMFFAFAQDPDLAKYATISKSQKIQINKAMGRYVTRLLTVDCKNEFKNAVKYEGNQAISQSFEYLGRVAGAAITSTPEVRAYFKEFAKYVDTKKLDELTK